MKRIRPLSNAIDIKALMACRAKSNTINDIEDWSTVVEGSFMPECMRFLDADLQRYRELFIKFNGVDTYNKINDRMNGE